MTKDLVREVAKTLRRCDVKFELESGVGGNADGVSSLPTLPSLIREGGAPILTLDFGDLSQDSHSEAVELGDPSLTLRMTGAEESRKKFSIFNFPFSIQKPPYSQFIFPDKNLTTQRLNVLSSSFKNAAFTLAEVLITLGVIGVVAAMTMPVLIQNYQKTTWVNQLKKSYSTLEQGFQKMMVDEEVDNLWDVSFFDVLHEEDCYAATFDVCKPLFDGLRNYFKGTYTKYGHDICLLHDKSCDDYKNDDVLALIDGTLLEFSFIPVGGATCEKIKAEGGHFCEVMGFLLMDINGNKGPNTYGRDVFKFYISENGKLYPQGGKDEYLFFHQGDISGYVQGAQCLKTNYEGTECTARIIENGWKMDY